MGECILAGHGPQNAFKIAYGVEGTYLGSGRVDLSRYGFTTVPVVVASFIRNNTPSDQSSIESVSKTSFIWRSGYGGEALNWIAIGN